MKLIDAHGINIKPPPRHQRCCFFSSTSRVFSRKDKGVARVQSAFKGVNYDFASTTPTQRAYIRQPIIINGAGPAGLILAIGLKNAKIPFEICETHRHDLPSRPRRNHVSILSSDILKPLRDFLRVPTFRSFLDEVALNPPQPGLDARRHDHSITTESWMELLRRQVRVNYGFRLEPEGISCLESVVTSQYRVGEAIRTLQGSLLVGADGIFSAGRFHNHIQNCPTNTASCSKRHVQSVRLTCRYIRFVHSHHTGAIQIRVQKIARWKRRHFSTHR